VDTTHDRRQAGRGPSGAGAPSGHQYELRLGRQSATVVEVGGGIRRYDDGERPVLDPYGVQAMADGAHGAALVPWPNRLGGGRYRFDGSDLQLPLTEPERGNAIHGLLRWRSWRPVEVLDDRVVLGNRIHPMPGYPFMLDVLIDYRLGVRGLEVATTATNVGETACPYGSGHHPYLSPGGAGETSLIDQCVLSVSGSTRITTDDRGLPRDREDVGGTRFDFREGKHLGDLQVDSAFTDLARDERGRAWVRLTGPDGRTAELWADHHYPYLEVFTGDTLAPDRRRRGLGCEPMTCPPNAFATATDVMRLEPGESVTTTWGARLM
jgi:aldose 1-epimerase